MSSPESKIAIYRVNTKKVQQTGRTTSPETCQWVKVSKIVTSPASSLFSLSSEIAISRVAVPMGRLTVTVMLLASGPKVMLIQAICSALTCLGADPSGFAASLAVCEHCLPADIVASLMDSAIVANTEIWILLASCKNTLLRRIAAFLVTCLDTPSNKSAVLSQTCKSTPLTQIVTVLVRAPTTMIAVL